MAKEDLESLGGCVVFEWGGSTRPSYGVTLLGALLAPGGMEREELVARYLEFRCSQYAVNPEPQEVHSTVVQTALALADDQVAELGAILQLAGLGQGAWATGFKAWTADHPRDIHLLSEERNFVEYLRRQALLRYQSDKPVGARERWDWEHRARPAREAGAFAFVQDPRLRALLEHDEEELKAAKAAGSWHCCVFLAGRILEGLLLAALAVRESGGGKGTEAERLEPVASDDLLELALNDLIKRADVAGLIGTDVRHLLEFARLHRNLIHPGRQLREGISITKDQAAIVVASVEVVRQRLAGSSVPGSSSVGAIGSD